MSLPYQQQYARITRDLINNPAKVGDSRIGKINSRFCEQMRIDLTKEFPLQDIKKIKPSNIIHELIWMLRGDTNIKYLVENGCHIWTDDAYRYYKEKYSPNRNKNNTQLNLELDITKDEFVEKVLSKAKTFKRLEYGSYTFGDLDRVYGQQWRNFNGKTDQLFNSMYTLIVNPDDRRMIVNAHNPTDIEEGNVGLPSCHNYFQFYTTILNATERTKYFDDFEFTFETDEEVHKLANERGYPSRRLSVFVNIRSNDWFLGQPYNAAQYALLTHIIAKIVGMDVGELVINSVDAHLYHAHFDAAKEWLDRYEKIKDDNYVGEQGSHTDWFKLFGCKAEININSDLKNINDITADDIEFTNYNPQGFIKAPLLT